MPTISLADEARYIHDSFFSQPLDISVVERYAAANRLCFPTPDRRSAEIVACIVSKRLDLEAVEVALRARRPDNFLSTKIQILFYLLEVRSEYYESFINDRNDQQQARRRLAWSAMNAAFKYLKGLYLVSRYGLV